jgi:phenylpropionate dioxygenase-like ring-hydroxylating dioxygenase large terminal subunit
MSSGKTPSPLRQCWHPVAYAVDVGTAPHAATLLEEPLAAWRDSRGAVHAFQDLCLHRGTALSLGTVHGDELACAYHGWRYGADGACTRHPPARGSDARPRSGAGPRLPDPHVGTTPISPGA